MSALVLAGLAVGVIVLGVGLLVLWAFSAPDLTDDLTDDLDDWRGRR